jgi:hypothetical protein
MDDIKKIKDDIKKVKNEISNLPNFNIQDLNSENIKNKIISILEEAEKCANEVDKINSIKKEIENRIIIPIDNRIKAFNTKSNLFTIISYVFGILGIILTVLSYTNSEESNKNVINKMSYLSFQNDIIRSRFEELTINKNIEFNNLEIKYLNKIDSVIDFYNPKRIRSNAIKLFLAYDSISSKYGYTNLNKRAIIPFKFDFADDFTDNVARVMINDKWGLINNSGEYIIYPKFHSISSIYKKHFLVFDKEYALYNLNGEKVASITDIINWGVFYKELLNSKIEDKKLIVRILQMYSDPDVRLKEIINIAGAYNEIYFILIDVVLKKYN